MTSLSLLLAKLWECLATRGWGLLLSEISGHQYTQVNINVADSNISYLELADTK